MRSVIGDQSDFDVTDQPCSRSLPRAKLPQDKLFWSQSLSPPCLLPTVPLMSPSNATKSAENPLTRTFSGECNFYGTLKGIQFSIRGWLFSQNLNGPGNKTPLCANLSAASPTTVDIWETKLYWRWKHHFIWALFLKFGWGWVKSPKFSYCLGCVGSAVIGKSPK